MPETIVVRGELGLPYSKGVMAQSLSASGIPAERAFELARRIEERLTERGRPEVEVRELYDLAEEVLRAEEGEEAARRFVLLQRLRRLERPLVVMLGGTAGVGKSTLATMLAQRLGITRVIATDVIRHVLRASFSPGIMPEVHYSSFEAARALERLDGTEDADLAGFARQAESVATGIEAIVQRACEEGMPMIMEGVHVVPGVLPPELRERCLPVEALVIVRDEDLHRGHFSLRGANRPAERYLRRFEEIRKLQSHLVERAEQEGVPVIDNGNVDHAVGEVLTLALEAAGTAGQQAG
jgi:2-phosphoglycerate kinase